MQLTIHKIPCKMLEDHQWVAIRLHNWEICPANGQLAYQTEFPNHQGDLISILHGPQIPIY